MDGREGENEERDGGREEEGKRRRDEGGTSWPRAKRRLKGVATGVFIALLVLFVLYSIEAFSVSPTETTVYRSVDYSVRGVFEHHGVFSNESVYQNGTAASYYPSGITDGIYGTYRYHVSRNVDGNYSIELVTLYYVQSGKKKVYMKNGSLWRMEGSVSSGRFSVPIGIDLRAISSNLSAIRRGLGLPRLSSDVYILINVKPFGMKAFEHRIYLMRDSSGLIHLKGTSKRYDEVSYHRETLTNMVSFLTVPVSVARARKMFPLLLLLSAVPLIAMYLPRKKEGSNCMDDLRKYMVEVKDDTFMRVKVKSRDDLEKLLDMLEGPVLHTKDEKGDIYRIISGNTVYEYRVPDQEDEEWKT